MVGYIVKIDKFASERKCKYSPTAVECSRTQIISAVNFFNTKHKTRTFFFPWHIHRSITK
jgi:hypothetical protein